jgi:uncharacterized protein YjbI with pentapeptide repeats
MVGATTGVKQPDPDPTGDSSPTAPVLAEKDALEREHFHLTNKKLKIETDRLERESDRENWWLKLVKNVVAVGGVVTVVASLYGIYESYNKTIDDRQRARVADQRVRFEDAIKRLESTSTISKLVGVAVLSGYLNAEDKEAHRQVLFTLAGLMATEGDIQTRSAVMDLLEGIPQNGAIEANDWFYFQDILVSQSRALMAKGNLSQVPPGVRRASDEELARAIGRLIALNARKGVVPKYTNYRGIYCAGCDFRNAVFPREVDFTGAVLDGTNFNRAKLEAAGFDNAHLAGTTFVEADLRQARFRSQGETVADFFLPRTKYLDLIAEMLDTEATVTVRMPKFNCANLEGATFSGHALFPGVLLLRREYSKEDQGKPGWYQTVPLWMKDRAERMPLDFRVVTVYPPTFFKAKLNGVNLRESRFFTFDDMRSRSGVFFMSSAQSIFGPGNFKALMGTMAALAFEKQPVTEEAAAGPPGGADAAQRKRAEAEREARETFGRSMRAAFHGAELGRVTVPEELAKFLTASKGEAFVDDYQYIFGASDPDLRCTPRLN